MELWIRSQDKEKLVLTKGFEIQHTNYDGGCQIFAVWENNYQMVGKYKNKERALEVLDEIQTQLVTLNYQYIHRGEHFIATESNVYEMPTE